jgi:hypothetical protein
MDEKNHCFPLLPSLFFFLFSPLLPLCSPPSLKHQIKNKERSKPPKMSKVHRNPPFRAEHLGSLLRPKDFLAQRAAFEKNEISQEVLTKAEDEAIASVVKVQLENNFHAITDGEYRYIPMSNL